MSIQPIGPLRAVLATSVWFFFPVFVLLTAPRLAQAGCDGFIGADDLDGKLSSLALQYPHIAYPFTFGESVEGRSLVGLRVSAFPQKESPEPEIRIIGGIHGDECQGVDEVLHIVDWLLSGYDTDSQIRYFVDHLDIVLIPLLNPDGYAAEPATRTNAHYVDLNRNFGFGWSEQNLFEPFSEPESRSLRDLSEENAFTLGLSYHTQAGYVNGPWNYTPFHPRDEALIDAIALDYAGDSEYEAVFGWEWYQISGDSNDWSLGTQGTFDWTIELTDGDDPRWEIHEPALRSFFSWALRGIHGSVRDGMSGLPLHAMISIEPEGEPVFSDATLGDYHRVLLEGAYEITAWAPGYRPKTILPVEVLAQGAATVDFFLQKDTGFAAGFRISQMTLPRDISNSYVQRMGYDNDSIVADALGMPDGYGYSLGSGGSVTIDMGHALPVLDGPQEDIRVVSSTRSEDMARIFVSAFADGPFIEAASGSGDIEFDLLSTGLPQIRYVKIVDENVTPFNTADSGYDLDAVVNLSHARLSRVDSETDSDSDSDNASDDTQCNGLEKCPQTPPPTALTGAGAFTCMFTQPGRTGSLLSLLQI